MRRAVPRPSPKKGTGWGAASSLIQSSPGKAGLREKDPADTVVKGGEAGAKALYP